MMATCKTHVTDALDDHEVSYRILAHQQPAFTVAEAAEQRGVPAEEMVKCILLRDKNGRYVMGCVQGSARINPSAVRGHLGEDWKRLSLASGAEIEQVTGYPKGAVAPLGLRSGIPVIFDETLLTLGKVNISSGDPKAGLELRPKDLIRVAGGRAASIAA